MDTNIGELKKELKEFKRKFRLIEKISIKNTDDFREQKKKKSKFFLDKDNNSVLNTFFEKFWNINLKKKNTQNNLSHKVKP